MDLKETIKIMSVIRAAYPRFYMGQGQEELNAAARVWQVMLADYDYQTVSIAVKALIATCKYPPVIAELTEQIYLLNNPDELTAIEAWGLVKKALKNSTYNAEAEFLKLPEEVRVVVGSSEQLRCWALDEEGATDTVTASNFQKSYKAKLENIKRYAMIPKDTKALIENAAGILMTSEVKEIKGQ